MNSPFKFLDAFTRDDRNAFFGREPESEALYQMVGQNRLILLYGQSGTGKTSLIQCGLGSRFDPTDWYPLFFRRNGDINATVLHRLEDLTPEIEPGATVPERLKELYVESLRPMYLVFDQLEELFILGLPEEQLRFAELLRLVLETTIPCRIILVIREEYLSHLYEMEKVLPTLFDRRMRVEPMGRNKVTAVLEGSFRLFNIDWPATEPSVPDRIIDNISAGKLGTPLPFLQVYLDLLYRAHTTEKGQNPTTSENWPEVHLEPEKIDALGRIENVLDVFLSDQTQAIQADMTGKFPGWPSNGVSRVLDGFVSEEGTKRPVGIRRKGEHLVVVSGMENLFHPLDAQPLQYCFHALEQRRLLRSTGEQLELAHDALAAVIDQQRSAGQRRINDLYNRLLYQYREYNISGIWLNRRQINALEEYLPALRPRIQPEVLDFYQQSVAQVEREEQAELLALRRKRRRARQIAIFGFSLAAVTTAALLIALFQFNENQKTLRAKAIQEAYSRKYEGRYAEALSLLDFVETGFGAMSDTIAKDIPALRQKWTVIANLVPRADSLRTNGAYLEALDNYKAAQQADDDAFLREKVTQTGQELESAFQKYMLSGEALMNARKYDMAITMFDNALALKPGDAQAVQRRAACVKR